MIALVAGTRPNFMKIAPIYRALHARDIPIRLIHTGQHFDPSMSDVFFRDLDLPTPHVLLRAGGGSQAEQTAAALVGIESALLERRPDAIVVVGDVTSTLAAALAAAKLGIPIVHVEAGLRSRDWTMPEEINRVLVDKLSDLLLIPSIDARTNLLIEGVDSDRIVFVGNVMIDSMRYALKNPTDILTRLTLERDAYALATLHRPANVDSHESLEATLRALSTLSARIPVIFPVHPRTVARADSFGLRARLFETPGLCAIEPLGYRDFVTLMASARLVATDSGGIQEETTALGIPCLTLRGGTERPVTVTEGTNVVVGLDPGRIDQELLAILEGREKKGRIPDGWDGRAGERVVWAIEALLSGSPPPKSSCPRA